MELTCTDLEKQGAEKRGYGADERGIDMDWFRIMLATLLAGLTGCIAYLSVRLDRTVEKLGNLEGLVKCMERLNRHEHHFAAGERQAIWDKFEDHEKQRRKN